MTHLKHRQPNYRYLHNKEKRTLKQGAIILLLIALIGGYVQSRSSTNQLRDRVIYAEDDSHHLSQPEPTTNLSITDQAGETNQVKEELGAISVVVPTPTPTTPPKPITQRQEIEKYIIEVFGEYADEAFTLLECENRNLDPLAVNDNTVWGGVGRDRGIFQINSVFHPLTDEQAFDYKQNIDYAWRMFRNDNYKFSRWTCGN